MTKGGKVAVGVTALAALVAGGAFLWSKSAQAQTSAGGGAGGGGTTPSGGGGGGGGGGNLPVCIGSFVPSVSDPAAVTLANQLLNGSGPVPYQNGTSYEQVINGRLWKFNMGRGLTNPGDGVEATVCTQTQ